MQDQTSSCSLILSSTSKSRKQVLQKLLLPFQQVSPNVDEALLPDEEPIDYVNRLSVAKAKAGFELATKAIQGKCLSIGSDQVAICNHEILGKPGTETKAREQLAKLSGNTVTFLTGLALTDGSTVQYDYDETIVSMRALSSQEIENYVALEQPIHAAGSFLSEALGIALFDSIKTNDPNALIGLPLIALCRLLRDHNINPLLSNL